MSARGTRRPHATRVYKRARKRASGGKKGGGKGCLLLVLALPALPSMAAIAAAVIR